MSEGEADPQTPKELCGRRGPLTVVGATRSARPGDTVELV